MRNRTFPDFVRHVGEPTVEAHSRGFEGESGQGAYERAPGASWRWTLEVRPLAAGDALALRAWLHSLRGPSGTFAIAMPYRRPPITAPPSGFGYSDGTDHTDDTDYADHGLPGGTIPNISIDYGTVTAAAVAGAESLIVTGFTPEIGAYLSVDTVTGPQLLRIVDELGITGGSVVTVRPRIRAAVAAAANVSHGRVTGIFRLVGQPPAVPLIVGRSLPLNIEIEEAY